MAEFEKVRGQLEGLWNGAMVEAEAGARKSGEAAGEERVLKALDVLVDEWRLDRPELVPELRRRLSLPEPVILDDGLERLTFAEWEARQPAPVVVDRPDFMLDIEEDAVQAASGAPYADWQERGVAPAEPEEVAEQVAAAERSAL